MCDIFKFVVQTVPQVSGTCMKCSQACLGATFRHRQMIMKRSSSIIRMGVFNIGSITCKIMRTLPIHNFKHHAQFQACCCESAAADERVKDHKYKKGMQTITCCNYGSWKCSLDPVRNAPQWPSLLISKPFVSSLFIDFIQLIILRIS